MAESDEFNRGIKRKSVGQDNITHMDSEITLHNEPNTLIYKKSLRDRMCKYSTQLPDSDEEDPYYETKGIVAKLVPDKECNNMDTEKGESTKTHTDLTVAQQCEELDSAELVTVDTESEKPVAYSQKHAKPEELEDRYTLRCRKSTRKDESSHYII